MSGLCRINGREDSAPLLGAVREALAVRWCLRRCVSPKAGKAFVETTRSEFSTDLLQLGLGVSRSLWRNNDGALQKTPAFHALYLLPRLVWELGSVGSAFGYKEPLAEFPAGSLRGRRVTVCVCKRKGVLSPFFLALGTFPSGWTLTCQLWFRSGRLSRMPAFPSPNGWLGVRTVGCQEKYLS